MIGKASEGKRIPRAPVPSAPVAMNGCNLVAQAMRQTRPGVVAAFPITPTTIIIESFSQFAANGEVDTEFVAVESEHSAMSACIGAAAAGARAQTVTTSQGLALMWELLPIASGLRLPIVMHCANRGLSAPITLHTDHSDTLGVRDSGWVQLYDATGQEAYDNALMAVRIAEHPDVLLPVLHTQDGFAVTHNLVRAELLPDDVAADFLGEYRPRASLLDLAHPVSIGVVAYSDYYFEFKRQQLEAMGRALEVVAETGREFGRLSGRHYGLTEGHRLDDAEYVVVVMGSTAGTAKAAVDTLRSKGMKAGMLRVRCYRPFPSEELAGALDGRKAVAVMDRSVSPGSAGNPLFNEVCAAMYHRNARAMLLNYVYGIGGRDTGVADIQQVFRELAAAEAVGDPGPDVRYLGLRNND